jgi:transketolase
VVVLGHHPEGGLGEAVLAALAALGSHPVFAHLAVRNLPGSGATDELLDAAGISAASIAHAAQGVLTAAAA